MEYENLLDIVKSGEGYTMIDDIVKTLGNLKKEGFIKKHGSTRSGYWEIIVE